MSITSNCPCGDAAAPPVITNSPGLSTIAYRIGDFTSFRDAMLQALPGEAELANWKPTSTTDLALQMIEWWAYLGDILTFYNQRIANQDYLRTADLDESVNRLIRVLGYRPRPGIGASATLAALVSAKKAITLPQGFAVQSKPGPGKTPQVFELSETTIAQPGGSISADADNSQAVLGLDGSVLLQGTVSSLKTGDLVVLVEKGWAGANSHYVLANVLSVLPVVSPRGTTNTQVILSASALPVPTGAIAANYRLLRSTQAARLFQYNVALSLSLVANADGKTGTADLDSVTRQIQPGDLVLFDAAGGQTGGAMAGPPIPQAAAPVSYHPFGGYQFGFTNVFANENLTLDSRIEAPALQAARFNQVETVTSKSGNFLTATNLGSLLGTLTGPPPMQLASVNKYTELIWYANNAASPADAPAAPIVGIPVFHSEITFTPQASALSSSSLLIRYGWQDAGVLIAPAATTFNGAVDLIAVQPPSFATGRQQILLEDANGNGDSASGTVLSTNLSAMQLAAALDDTLDPPVNVLTNLLPFTRGKTVPAEVLGSGDATVAGQVFTLSKSPLTYLLSSDSSSGANYSSTLQVSVNTVKWTEQPSFYGQPPDAQIFVTSEDENNITHVQFGDGVNGARLPTGANNVTATYRYGSGQAAPDAGTLTVITTPQPGLASVHNPVAAGGGADPEASSQMRKYAPLSVLAFGRAISGDDYEAIAASTPGVARASAAWSFDASQQRTVVRVYVGDDLSAQSAAQLALGGDADPNRPITVLLAQPIALVVSLTLAIGPQYDQPTVVAAATAALIDPDLGLFGANRIGIGEVIFRSQIYAACLSVEGAVAVHNLNVAGAPAGSSYRFDPGEGYFFSVDPIADFKIAPEVASA